MFMHIWVIIVYTDKVFLEVLNWLMPIASNTCPPTWAAFQSTLDIYESTNWTPMHVGVNADVMVIKSSAYEY